MLPMLHTLEVLSIVRFVNFANLNNMKLPNRDIAYEVEHLFIFIDQSCFFFVKCLFIPLPIFL